MTDATVADLNVIDGDKEYKIRKLNNGDTRRLSEMISKVTGNPRFMQALASENNILMLATGISVALETLPRDKTLLVADLIGVANKYPFGTYRDEVLAEETANNTRYADRDGEIRYRRDTAILEEMDVLPGGTDENVIREVMERGDFEDFLTSFTQLIEAGKKTYSNYLTLSGKNTDTPIATS